MLVISIPQTTVNNNKPLIFAAKEKLYKLLRFTNDIHMKILPSRH